MGYLINIRKLKNNPRLQTYFKELRQLKRNYVRLYCKICGKKEIIHTNNKFLYTQEVKNNHICFKCKMLGKNLKIAKTHPNLFNYEPKFK